MTALSELHVDAHTTSAAMPVVVACDHTYDAQWLEAVAKVRTALHQAGRASGTIDAYMRWIRRFYREVKGKSPEVLIPHDVSVFLQHLGSRDTPAASSRNQALAALRCFFSVGLQHGLADPVFSQRTQAAARKHSVIDQTTERLLLEELPEAYRLVVRLISGTGLRLPECLALRIGDVDMEARTIRVYGGRKRDRVVPLPVALVPVMAEQRARVLALLKRDRRMNSGTDAAAAVGRDPGEVVPDGTQIWLFPATSLTVDLETGALRRLNVPVSTVQHQLTAAMRRVGITGHAGIQALRRAHAVRLLKGHTDVATVQRLLGHAHVRTTKAYTGYSKRQRRTQNDLALPDVHSDADGAFLDMPRSGRRTRRRRMDTTLGGRRHTEGRRENDLVQEPGEPAVQPVQ